MKVGFIMFSYGAVTLGAGSVVGSLIQNGHNVVFFNLNNAVGNNLVEKTVQELKVRKAIRTLIKADCEMYFFSVLSMDMPQSLDIVRRLKKHHNRPVLFGGVHPTILGETFLTLYPEIDYICVGEGESMVLEVVKNLHNLDALESIPNLGYRNTKGISTVNPIRQPEDLAKLPKFPWHLFPRKHAVDPNGFLYVRATRGCPYKCTFCCNTSFLKLYGKEYLRKRPIKNVIDEMKFLKNEYQPKLFCFVDEMLIWDKAYSLELFQRVKEDIGLPFGFVARVEYINEELVKVAADCGCKQVGLGIECGDEEFRKTKLNRHNTNEQIIKAFALLKKHGIQTVSFNIIGYPFEGDENLTKATVALNAEILPDYAQFTIFYPFVGTALYDYCKENDLIDTEKQQASQNVYNDSILKGITLHKKRMEIDKIFNKSKTQVFKSEDK